MNITRIITCRMRILRHRTTTLNKESIGAAFGCDPQGPGAPPWMLSLFNVVVLCLRMRILRAIVRVVCAFGMILWMISMIAYIHYFLRWDMCFLLPPAANLFRRYIGLDWVGNHQDPSTSVKIIEK